MQRKYHIYSQVQCRLAERPGNLRKLIRHQFILPSFVNVAIELSVLQAGPHRGCRQELQVAYIFVKGGHLFQPKILLLFGKCLRVFQPVLAGIGKRRILADSHHEDRSDVDVPRSIIRNQSVDMQC